MKSIDIKSLLIGALLASTIFLGVAATSPADKWDEKQEWKITDNFNLPAGEPGLEPYARGYNAQKVPVNLWRKRVK
jgi:hypothetical protein